jgi:hypothetical protein
MTPRATPLLAVAALLATTPVARAHYETRSFYYLKRHYVGDTQVQYFTAAEGCELRCYQHGYEHDAYDNPIPGHQYGESWDCRYQVEPDHGVTRVTLLAPVTEAAAPVLAQLYGGIDGTRAESDLDIGVVPCPLDLPPIVTLLPGALGVR